MLGMAVVSGLLAAQWLTNQSSRGIKRIVVATPAVNNAAAMSEIFCIGVMNGSRNSTECH